MKNSNKRRYERDEKRSLQSYFIKIQLFQNTKMTENEDAMHGNVSIWFRQKLLNEYNLYISSVTYIFCYIFLCTKIPLQRKYSISSLLYDRRHLCFTKSSSFWRSILASHFHLQMSYTVFQVWPNRKKPIFLKSTLLNKFEDISIFTDNFCMVYLGFEELFLTYRSFGDDLSATFVGIL